MLLFTCYIVLSVNVHFKQRDSRKSGSDKKLIDTSNKIHPKIFVFDINNYKFFILHHLYPYYVKIQIIVNAHNIVIQI